LTRQRIAVALCLALIVAATLTSGGRGESVRWSIGCVICSETWLADAISNVALFAPFGAALTWARAPVGRAALIGSAAALTVELLQYAGLPSGRTPAVLDWLTNSMGTALGVAVVALWQRLANPSLPIARGLACVWTVVICMVFGGVSFALAPDTSRVGVSGDALTSNLPFTPGYGWFEGFADSAVVNGVLVPHRGTGPVIVATSPTELMTASVRVRGRDSRTAIVPILYAHDVATRDARVEKWLATLGRRRVGSALLPAQETARRVRGMAHLIIAQRGNDATMQSTLRAYRLGLVAPTLAVSTVSSNSLRNFTDSLTFDLAATVTRRAWSLSVKSSVGQKRTATLLLTPALGWALVQSVVGLDSVLASVLTMLWLLAWFAPLGHWIARAKWGTSWRPVALWGAAVLALLGGGAIQLGSGPLTVPEATMCCVGVLTGWRLSVRSKRLSPA
jgi:hypothetical protein